MTSWILAVFCRGQALDALCPLGLELLLSDLEEMGIPVYVSMPSRAWVVTDITQSTDAAMLFQCPHGLIPHFYQFYARATGASLLLVSMPSRAYTSFLQGGDVYVFINDNIVSMPSRAYTSFLHSVDGHSLSRDGRVNALSGLYLISTWKSTVAITSADASVNALSGLYLISTVPLQKPRFYAVSRTCFCRYLSEYSDNSRFSCMLTFWTYLMRCTYPWHWI